jgi:Ca2+ transporting ATPase
MGQDGCSAAKDHADVILMDDNFETVITAIRYGRNIQDNVRKFIQFQMTVNVSCMIFVLSTALILGHSPFSVMQLLWINLIMDVLAAIAFSTENPHPTEIRKERINAKENIITKPMMRSILSQSMYQLFVMVLMLYAGPAMFKIPYKLYTEDLRNSVGDVEVASNRLLH